MWRGLDLLGRCLLFGLLICGDGLGLCKRSRFGSLLDGILCLLGPGCHLGLCSILCLSCSSRKLLGLFCLLCSVDCLSLLGCLSFGLLLRKSLSLGSRLGLRRGLLLSGHINLRLRDHSCLRLRLSNNSLGSGTADLVHRQQALLFLLLFLKLSFDHGLLFLSLFYLLFDRAILSDGGLWLWQCCLLRSCNLCWGRRCSCCHSNSWCSLWLLSDSRGFGRARRRTCCNWSRLGGHSRLGLNRLASTRRISFLLCVEFGLLLRVTLIQSCLLVLGEFGIFLLFLLLFFLVGIQLL